MFGAWAAWGRALLLRCPRVSFLSYLLALRVGVRLGLGVSGGSGLERHRASQADEAAADTPAGRVLLTPSLSPPSPVWVGAHQLRGSPEHRLCLLRPVSCCSSVFCLTGLCSGPGLCSAGLLGVRPVLCLVSEVGSRGDCSRLFSSANADTRFSPSAVQGRPRVPPRGAAASVPVAVQCAAHSRAAVVSQRRERVFFSL